MVLLLSAKTKEVEHGVSNVGLFVGDWLPTFWILAMTDDSKNTETTKGTAKSLIFSITVDQLARVEPPDNATLCELLGTLRGTLVIELKRRGVWRAPPSFLRIVGDSWTANGSEALHELAQDAYFYIFVQRLGTLIEGRRHGHDVGPLVYKLIRQFISKRQRSADPVGYGIYSKLRDAVQKLAETEQLHIAGEGQRIHNRTMLAFTKHEGKNAQPTAAATLAELVSPWNQDLMPELVTALGKAVIPLIENLQERILSLNTQGVEAFRFGDLITPLKRDARQRWNAVWAETRGEIGIGEAKEDGFAEMVPITRPHHPVEYESLLDCVASAIGGHDPGGDQGSLWYLWVWTRGVHRTGDEPRRVSVNGVATLLEVSRRRVGKLLKVLQGMVTTCLSAFEAPAQPIQNLKQTAPYAKNTGR